ncbi:MAG: hypothetical protein PHX43_04195 [Alphaproteobacteria bacterium]|nr:hypothetical protein [Alphaproteobacteria bacterium]
MQIFNQHLSPGDMAFAFGVQGIGSQLKAADEKTRLWTAIQTPFISLHYDHPCHNIFNHFSDSPFVANMYHSESFLETKERYLPSNQISKFMPYGFVGFIYPPHIPFAERSIKLLYMKNSADLSEEEAYCEALPAPMCAFLRQQIERAKKDPNLQLCDLVDEIFTSFRFDRDKLKKQFWDLVRLMDRFIRHARAVSFIEWLKLQEGAVIIGNGWDFIDKTNARAIFKPAMNADKSHLLYDDSQIVCNTNPYGRDAIHERTLAGLASGTCVFSDTNSWWEKNCSDVPSLTLFNWNDPLDDQLQPRLANMGKAAEDAAGSYDAYNRIFPMQNMQNVIDLVEEVKIKTKS